MGQALQWEILSPAVGVEVEGIDLQKPFSSEQQAELRRLLDEHQLILFRNQTIDGEAQVRTLSVFGKISDENEDGSGYSIVSNVRDDTVVREGRLFFHSDFAWTNYLTPVFSLYGMDIDGPSSPTLFANCVKACRNLPPELRERLEKMTLVQAYNFTKTGGYDVRPRLLEMPEMPPTSTYPRAEHPVILRNPRTGTPLLFAMQAMTSHIVGLSAEQSEALLQDLFARLYVPDNIYTHQWNQGDLVIWDSVSLQHGRPTADETMKLSRRTLRRVVVSDKTPRDHNKDVKADPAVAARFKKLKVAGVK